jgi:hypothetical protein
MEVNFLHIITHASADQAKGRISKYKACATLTITGTEGPGRTVLPYDVALDPPRQVLFTLCDWIKEWTYRETIIHRNLTS